MRATLNSLRWKTQRFDLPRAGTQELDDVSTNDTKLVGIATT